MLTINTNQTGADYEDGWHEVTISKAINDKWQDTRYIDLNFEGYSDALKQRIWSATNKETGEDFSIGNLFYHANAGITNNEDGIATIDDNPTNLIGKKLNVLFYKNENGYTEVVDRTCPVVQKTDTATFTDSFVASIKTKVERRRDSKTNVISNGAVTDTDGVPAF